MAANGEATGRRDWFTSILAIGALGLAVLVLVLAWQNRELKRRLAEVHTPEPALEAGERLGPIALFDPDGASAPLEFTPGERTVVLFFTPTCPACRATIPVWREVVATLELHPRVLGVDLGPPGRSGAREELMTDTWPFPVYQVDAERSAGLADISYVPATVVVDGDGVVERVWFGQLDGDEKSALRALLEAS